MQASAIPDDGYMNIWLSIQFSFVELIHAHTTKIPLVTLIASSPVTGTSILERVQVPRLTQKYISHISANQ